MHGQTKCYSVSETPLYLSVYWHNSLILLPRGFDLFDFVKSVEFIQG